MRTKKCSCGATIMFIKNHKGNMVPVNAEARRRYVMTKGHPADIGGLFDGEDTIKWQLLPCYVPHHETCPNVLDYRKKEPEKPAETKLKDREFWDGKGADDE